MLPFVVLLVRILFSWANSVLSFLNDSKMTPQVSGLVSPPASNISSESSKSKIRAAKVQELAEPKVWNTKNLGLRLAADFTAGFSAACMVAPLITVIDKFVLSPSLMLEY